MTINPVHTALMHNGKILVVAGSGNCPPSQSGCPSGAPYGASNHSGATVFDPVAQTFNQLSLSWDMFCNSMTVLPDGRVFVNGGTMRLRSVSWRTKEQYLRSGYEHLYRRSDQHGARPLVSDRDLAQRWPGHDFLRVRRDWGHEQDGRDLHRRFGLESAVHSLHGHLRYIPGSTFCRTETFLFPDPAPRPALLIRPTRVWTTVATTKYGRRPYLWQFGSAAFDAGQQLRPEGDDFRWRNLGDGHDRNH